MKRPTKAQKINDYYQAYEALKAGRRPKRTGARNGSIATHSMVVVSTLLEKDVLSECMKWLKVHRILANRNNVGFGDIGGTGNMYRYGIVDAGDIIGLLSTGRHFELECKRSTGGRLSLGQQKRMLLVRENKGIYLVIHGVGELEYYWEKLND